MAANVWVALADPNSPAGSVPYVDPTTLVPAVDVTNFAWKSVLKYLYIAGGFKTDYTIAPAAGAVVINKAAGVGKIAAAAQSIVVTNSVVKDANTLVIPFLLTDDATAKSVIAVPAAGSVTLKLNAAATAQVSVGFIVLRNSEVE